MSGQTPNENIIETGQFLLAFSLFHNSGWRAAHRSDIREVTLQGADFEVSANIGTDALCGRQRS